MASAEGDLPQETEPSGTTEEKGEDQAVDKPQSESSSDAQVADVEHSSGQGARPKAVAEPESIKQQDEGKERTGGEEILPISDSCLDNLSAGLLDALLPHFQKHEESLAELTRNQVLQIETLQQENQKFAENKMVGDLTKMMLQAKQYQVKLTAVKKEMTSLHEKSTKLKKRALKLQQQRMKENLEKEQQREKEIEEDRKLAAKRPTTSTKTAPHR